jgi:hypothetical protein
MLANVEQHPAGEYSADENLHREAQKLLHLHQIEDAWELLKT